MRGKIKQVQLIFGLLQFRNINLASKGCYKLKLQVFAQDQPLTLGYHSSQDLQENNYSTTRQCLSHEDSESTRQKSSHSEQNTGNAFWSMPFFVKYHCQRIKLKSLALFTLTTIQQLADVQITLYRKQTLSNQHFQEVQSIQFSVNCSEHYLQQREILVPAPECCSMKIVILSCPIIQYEQIYSMATQQTKYERKKNPSQQQQNLLEQMRKMVKRQRYESFVLKKELCDVMKYSMEEPLKLPLHFLQKENMSMDQVETSQLKFFKYMAFYQRYYTSSEMLKEEMAHINFDKITIIKSFIDSFQKQQLLFNALDQKQSQTIYKKHRNYLITTEVVISPEQLLTRYSSQELKTKKDKIKQLDASIYSSSCSSDHIMEENFGKGNHKDVRKNSEKEKDQKKYTSTEKNNRKNGQNEKSIIKYPLLFWDVIALGKENPTRTDTLMPCILTNKVRKKKKYFIFAHGFQGLPIDLTFLVNIIRFSNEKIKTFVLKSYKNHMNESIDAMGKRAAQEIEGIFKKVNLNEIQPQISFIGHSMGPIILRAALKHLTQFHECFGMFVSICAPHLGYIQGTKFLTEAGLSILSKLKPIECLNQLSNRDNNDIQKTFIYKLSKQGSLKNFKRVILVSSMSDDYVPWHSARVEPYCCKGGKQKIEREMISNIFGIGSKDARIQKIERVQISFPQQKQKSLNSLIGRTSHVKPLSDRGFLEIMARQILRN